MSYLDAPKASINYPIGNSRFSNDALHIICCSALCSEFTPEHIQSLFLNEMPSGELSRAYRPVLTHNLNLAKVKASEIVDVLWAMEKNQDPVYVWWKELNPSAYQQKIHETLQPLIAGGLMCSRNPNLNTLVSEPNWTWQLNIERE